MFGTSVGTQATADDAIPKLREMPGRRFLSVEPLLEPVRLNLDGIEWCIVGCESGAKRRGCPHLWMRSILHQCREAGTCFFSKQMDINGKVETDIDKFPLDLAIRQFPAQPEPAR